MRTVEFDDGAQWDFDIEGIVVDARPLHGSIGYEVIGKPRVGKPIQVRKLNGHIFKSPKVVACHTVT